MSDSTSGAPPARFRFINQHTPGPWTIASRDGESEYWINAETWTQLASVYSTEDLLSDPEAEANAKLIATAPEMADILYEQWELERCEDATCVDHGPLISVLRSAGRLAEDAPEAPSK